MILLPVSKQDGRFLVNCRVKRIILKTLIEVKVLGKRVLYCRPISLGPQLAGVKCPLTSSLGDFPCRLLGKALVYWATACVIVHCLPPPPSISQCFSIHSSSAAIRFHSCFFFATDVSAPIRSTRHLLTF